MSNATETLVISGPREVVEAIRDLIDRQGAGQSYLTERKNLDGGTATWIVIATLSMQVLPHVLELVRDYLGAKRVTKIKMGDLEIENPSPEDVQRFRAILDARAKAAERT